MTFTVLFMGSLFVMVSNNSIQITWCNGWKKQSFFCLFVFSWRACNENSVWVSFCCCLVTKSCPTLCNPRDCNTSGSSVLHYLLEFAEIDIWCYLSISSSAAPSPFAYSLSQHQGLFQWVGFTYQVAKVLELQHQSFQWIFRVDLL